MGIESSVTHIDDLDPVHPTPTDGASQGDDHLRNIKAALKNTFPNLTGPMTATQGELNALAGNGVPSGCIVMWSGSIGSIPDGWVLCNGQNGTPNLRDRFVVGAGGSYDEYDTGGSSSVTLTESQIPSHNHSRSGLSLTPAGQHKHTATCSAAGQHKHTHGVRLESSAENVYGTKVVPASTRNVNGDTDSSRGISGYTDVTAHHVHNITISTNADHNHGIQGQIGHTGGGNSHENRPPYFALAYIMKS